MSVSSLEKAHQIPRKEAQARREAFKERGKALILHKNKGEKWDQERAEDENGWGPLSCGSKGNTS